jgi:hypothetical protein
MSMKSIPAPALDALGKRGAFSRTRIKKMHNERVWGLTLRLTDASCGTARCSSTCRTLVERSITHDRDSGSVGSIFEFETREERLTALTKLGLL